MATKTKARRAAEHSEAMRMSPAITKEKQTSEGMKGPRMMAFPAQVYDAVRSAVSKRTPRTEEEMSELTREMARAGYSSGGKVKKYASGGMVRGCGTAKKGGGKGTVY